MKSEYKGSTTLICTSCGSKNLEVSADKAQAKCNACHREYPGGYKELVRLNQPRIDADIENMKKQVLDDTEADLLKTLDSIFKRR
jgi:hypothetical protein